MSDTSGFYTHYIYPHYPHIERSAFQRENPSHNPWELVIIIPTILYTIHCGFPQLLPIHFQIVERLIAHTITILILSVKWGFGVTGKYWKKPYIWWMQSGWIAWFGELENTSLVKLVGSRSLEGSSTWDRLGLEGLLLFVYSNLFSSGSIYRLEDSGKVFRRVLRFPLW